jgi:hypothetical protein
MAAAALEVAAGARAQLVDSAGIMPFESDAAIAPGAPQMEAAVAVLH